MKTKRIIAFITMLVMSVTVISQCFVTAFAEDTVISTDGSAVGAETLIDDVEVSGTNSVGDLLASEFQEKQAEQLENNGYNIFSIEMDGNIATVDFQVQNTCTLIVGIYDDSKTTMFATGTIEVSEEDELVEVEIPLIIMPDYFYVKAYLVNSETLEPLCLEYTNPNYTQHMQEFFSKTTDDFDEEKVLNFDDDKTNNFAVYSDDVTIIPYEEGFNTSVTYDEETGTYTIENASEDIQSLKEGDLFAYDDGTGNPIVAKIDSISVDGTTVTIVEGDTSLDEVFDLVRINVSQDLNDANVECYDGTELIDGGIDDGESTPAEANVNMPGEAPNTKASASYTKTLEHKFKDSDFKKEVNTDINKNPDKLPTWTGEFKITGSAKLSLGVEATLNLFFDEVYFEFKIPYSSVISFDVTASCEFTLPIGHIEFSNIPGLYVTITPSVVFKITCSLNASITTEGCFDIKVTKDGVENISEWPKTTPDVKIQGEVFFGIDFKPGVYIIDERVVSASLSVLFGVKLIGKLEKKIDTETEMDVSKIDSFHECAVCLDGDANIVAQVKFEIDILNIGKFTLKPINIDEKMLDFYYSYDKDEMGLNECPNIYHKIKIKVVDNNKKALPGTQVECKPSSAFKTMSLPYITETAKDLVTDENGFVTVYARMGKTKVICTHGSSEPKEFELTTAIGVDDVFLLNGIEQETLTCTLKPKKYVVKVTVTDNDDRILI